MEKYNGVLASAGVTLATGSDILLEVEEGRQVLLLGLL
jgi:hypothetical protein